MPADLPFREFNPLKIWHHADRLQAIAAGKDVAPVTVEIDPVAYCNHNCFWCVDPVHRPITASLTFLQQMVRELASFQIRGFGVHGLVFKGGGEPTLHADFPHVIELAREIGFDIGVVTNGSRLHHISLAASLAQLASYVRVSVDGPTRQTHRRVHRSDDFDQIVHGVELLMSYRQRRHPIVGLSFAMDHSMIPVIPEAIALGDRLGVDYVLLRPPFFEEVGRPSTMTTTRAAELRSALAQISKSYTGPMDIVVGLWKGDAEKAKGACTTLASSGRRDHQVSSDDPIEHRLGACWASPLLAVVAADGQVYGCCNLRYLDDWSFGKVDYQRGVTLTDIWLGARRQQVLSRMHAAECIAHCTHPLTRYNEIIQVLRDREKPHSGFV